MEAVISFPTKLTGHYLDLLDFNFNRCFNKLNLICRDKNGVSFWIVAKTHSKLLVNWLVFRKGGVDFIV